MNVSAAKTTATKSPLLSSSTFLPSTPGNSNTASRRLRKGITTQLTYVPLSPRLQALASPGPCTPLSLEEATASNASVAAGVGGVPVGGNGDYLTYGQEKLDAAFARHKRGASERRTYSSVLASQR